VDKFEAPETSAQAIERMMDAYGSGILRLCCLYLKDYALAEDAAQEAFIRAYRGLNSFRGQSSEKTWLTRIAINVCKNMLRSPWRRLRDWTATQRLPEPACSPEARDGDVLRAVTGLPVKYREVVLLYYYQEMTVREIAFLLDVPQATVSTRLSRGRARLKDALEGWWRE
jgi:RNA polymerase sigma-70 factor (ECF subfamily)